MSTHDAIKQAVDEAFETQVSTLQRLVDQPSHTFARDDVEAAAEILEEIATGIGFTTDRHPATDPQFADHRVFKWGDPGDQSLALVGHIDTVFPRSSGFLSFSRDGDTAFGPGVLDMKSGLTTILFAVNALKSCGLSVPLQFICVSEEEVGSPTSRDLYAELAPTISRAMVFEKGRDEDRIITCRKGGGSFRIDVEGKATHAGNAHDKGINAIHALALLIPKIEAFTDYDRGVTVNVGLIEGGTAKNTVPQFAHCVIDARFITADDAIAFQKKLEALVDEPLSNPRLVDAKFTVTGNITRPPMEATDENVALCSAYETYAKMVGLGVGQAPRQGGFSDSNLLAANGVPTIDGLGPYGDGAHSLDEWCDLESLRRRTQALALFLANEV